MLEFRQYISSSKPQNLLIFLHGYNGNWEDHQYIIDRLTALLPNTAVIVPLAPEICDKNQRKRQWFGMLKYDAEARRIMPQTKTAEIFSIYEAAAAEIADKSALINNFVSARQKELGFSDDKTYIAGFSQGAMLAIYAALTRDKKLGGVFAFSGLVAAKNSLSLSIKSRPTVYMFHGEQDMKVQYKTLAESKKWLEDNLVPLQVTTYPNLAHCVNEDEIISLAEIIK